MQRNEETQITAQFSINNWKTMIWCTVFKVDLYLISVTKGKRNQQACGQKVLQFCCILSVAVALYFSFMVKVLEAIFRLSILFIVQSFFFSLFLSLSISLHLMYIFGPLFTYWNWEKLVCANYCLTNTTLRLDN